MLGKLLFPIGITSQLSLVTVRAGYMNSYWEMVTFRSRIVNQQYGQWLELDLNSNAGQWSQSGLELKTNMMDNRP